MTEKRKTNPFLKLIAFLFFIFLIIYCIDASGYYESKMHAKTVYTNEKILEFEEDVKNGVEIDLNKYVLDEDKDYSNKYSRFSDRLGETITQIMGGGIDSAAKVFKVLFG